MVVMSFERMLDDGWRVGSDVLSMLTVEDLIFEL